jgi:NADH-quinone oxidoreductase subunit F/NADP-reducing hydrogenase subunit HndC
VGRNRTVVSVGLDSSSIPKGADKVLAACRAALATSDAVVREVSGNGALWMEPWVEIMHPGEPPVVYGNIEPADVPLLLAGGLRERAVGVRAAGTVRGHSAAGDHPFFKHQQRIVLQNMGIIDPWSIEDAVARGAYSAY